MVEVTIIDLLSSL